MEEPASVAPNQCKTSLAPVFGLQPGSSPALHLPTSPLLQSLFEDTNLALARFVEDRTVHGFLPVPGRRHRLYYRTSSSSFPGPYTVLPSLASITLEKVSESRKHSVSLSHSQVSSLETMLSSVCEVTSWLDWWLSTCGSFQEPLTDKARGNFKRLMLSSSRALEFLGCQGVTALGNLVSRAVAQSFAPPRCKVHGTGGRGCPFVLCCTSRVSRSFSLYLTRFCSGQNACSVKLRSCTLSRFPGSLQRGRSMLDRRPPLLRTAVAPRPWCRGRRSRLRRPLPLPLPSRVGSGRGEKVRRPFRLPPAAPVAYVGAPKKSS